MNNPPPFDQLPQAAKDLADHATQAAKDAAQHGIAATKDAAQHATQAAKDLYKSAATRAEDIYHTAAVRAEDTLVQSKQYVRENPVPVVLGAFAVGLTLGCLMGLSHHHPEPTLRDRFRW
ncbi:MAG: hypothetical protein B7Z37_04020 [Verrucomicrobia bacterium 12-59-8]|nr:MAG: hypothetical protein B7Z37_04020 [Verrucomicrobia bacterium 12-59-8]